MGVPGIRRIGVVIDPKGEGYSERELSPVDAMAAWTSGSVVIGYPVDEHIRIVDSWAARLAQELGLTRGAVHVSSFLGHDGVGMPKHCDPWDVIVLQLHGQKSWTTAPNHDVPNPTGNIFPPSQCGPEVKPYAQPPFSAAMPPDAATHHMTAGSALYVPRGTWHSTKCTQDSVSLSFSITRPLRLDAAPESERPSLLLDPSWRAVVPLNPPSS